MERYLVNPAVDLHITRGNRMTVKDITSALHNAHEVLRKLEDFDVNLAELLGMRNLSSFVGEVFAAGMVKACGGLFRKNPHQDGYPDLLVMDGPGKKLWESLEKRWRDKSPFSPFQTGGVEIKATCGSVPNDTVCRRLGFEGKPSIGDARIPLLRSYDWKAHHQETNYLIGLVWDFIERRLRIVGVFYSNSLQTTYGPSNKDWGSIIQPREGGGRTTSVSIMTRAGVHKMYKSWVLVLDDERYMSFFDRYNKSTLIAQAHKKQSQPMAL